MVSYKSIPNKGYQNIPFQSRQKPSTNNSRGSRTTYQKFRQKALTRDHYQCVICNKRQTKGLRIHHLCSWENNKSKRFELNNVVTLCANCHDENVVGSFHYMYGTNDNTLEEFCEYYYSVTGKMFFFQQG